MRYTIWIEETRIPVSAIRQRVDGREALRCVDQSGIEGDRVPPLDDSSAQRSSPGDPQDSPRDARPVVQGMRAYFPRAALTSTSII